jgi:hypothetical protein
LNFSSIFKGSMMRWFLLLLLFTLAPNAFAQNSSYKVEAIGALTEKSVSESVRAALSDKGLRVVDEKGKPVCEVWFSKSISTKKDAVAGANFGQITEGSFVGVINFPSSASDYRGQGIKAGFYTLRFGLIMQDGNHLGVSPTRDFLLASPVAEDKDPAAQFKPEDLYKLSRNAAGTSHPSVWSLVPASSKEGLPKVTKNEHEHIILETRIPTGSGDLSIGLIVVGKTEG